MVLGLGSDLKELDWGLGEGLGVETNWIGWIKRMDPTVEEKVIGEAVTVLKKKIGKIEF